MPRHKRPKKWRSNRKGNPLEIARLKREVSVRITERSETEARIYAVRASEIPRMRTAIITPHDPETRT